jgi:hypothetical protein
MSNVPILADPRFLGVIPDEIGQFLAFLWGYTKFVVKSIFFLMKRRQDVTTRYIVGCF